MLNIFIGPEEQKDRATKAQISYLSFLYVLGSFFMTFYFLKDLLTYGLHNEHYIVAPILILFYLLPFYYRKGLSFNTVSTLACSFAAIVLNVIIFQGGGIFASGTFWLTIIPINTGILLGRNGIIWGGILLFLSLVTLLALEHFGIRGDLIPQEQTRKLDTIIDLFTYSIFVLLATYYFITAEEKSRKTQLKYQKEVETLLRTVLHDIASPIQVLQLSYSAIKKSGPQDEMMLKHLYRMERSINNTVEIIDLIRKLQSLKDGKNNGILVEVSLQNLIENTIEMLTPQAEDKGIEIKLDVVGHSPKVMVEPTMFQNFVLSNFLTNAIKFSHLNGKILVRIESIGTFCQVSIRDWGIGIPDDMKERLFSINRPTSRAGTKGEIGTGYGLPLANEYIQKLGGELRINSESKAKDPSLNGTEVIIKLPITG